MNVKGCAGYEAPRRKSSDRCRWAMPACAATQILIMESTVSGPMGLNERLDEIEQRANKAIEGPWFTAGDDLEAGPHTNSGLALIETGRNEDWWPARLCEWPTAEFIASARTDVPALHAVVQHLRKCIKAECSGVVAQACDIEVAAILNEGGSSVEPKVTKSEAASSSPESVLRGPIEGEMWEAVEDSSLPHYWHIKIRGVVVELWATAKDCIDLAAFHNNSIQRVADLGKPGDENGPRSQQVR